MSRPLRIWQVRAICVIRTLFIPIFRARLETSAFFNLLHWCDFLHLSSSDKSVRSFISFDSGSHLLLQSHASARSLPSLPLSLPCSLPSIRVFAFYFLPSHHGAHLIIPSNPSAVRLFSSFLTTTLQKLFYAAVSGGSILLLTRMPHQQTK